MGIECWGVGGQGGRRSKRTEIRRSEKCVEGCGGWEFGLSEVRGGEDDEGRRSAAKGEVGGTSRMRRGRRARQAITTKRAHRNRQQCPLSPTCPHSPIEAAPARLRPPGSFGGCDVEETSDERAALGEKTARELDDALPNATDNLILCHLV